MAPRRKPAKLIPHDHTTVVPGCFRCDISKDEVRCDRPWDECDDVLAERNRLRAEVAALQKRLIEEPPYDGDLVSVLKERNRTLQAEVAALACRVERLAMDLGRSEAREAEACALLAEGAATCEARSTMHRWAGKARAFLRRDEGER